MATAINDFIQGIIMLFGIVVIVLAVLNGKGGFMGSLPQSGGCQDPTVTDTGRFRLLLRAGSLGLLFVVLLTSFGTWGLPPDGTEILRHQK